MGDPNRNQEENRTDDTSDMQKKPSQGSGDFNQGGQPGQNQSGNQGSDKDKNRDQETDRKSA
jgi:hypothetical protein